MSGKSKVGEPLHNKFKVPPWAGKPPSGLHLDVMKDGKLIQKLMIDEKVCYFFGRNRQLCDFPIDHESASRVHAALVWHKHLNRPFLIDCNSAHGTFLGRIRLEAEKPQQVPPDAELHFGASTRRFVIRERPQSSAGGNLVTGMNSYSIGEYSLPEYETDGNHKSVLSAMSARRYQRQYQPLLPETEGELENLTEFNTAHNRRLATMTDFQGGDGSSGRKRSSNEIRRSVTFNDMEMIINPEDVDPSVGRFRNLVKESFIPNAKKAKMDNSSAGKGYYGDSLNTSGNSGRPRSPPPQGHPDEKDVPSTGGFTSLSLGHYAVAAKLGLPMPNLAPDVEESDVNYEFGQNPHTSFLHHQLPHPSSEHDSDSQLPHHKKKYAKEAWPGKRPSSGFLVGPTMQ